MLDARDDQSDVANEIRKLLAEVSEARVERNRLVHGLWGLTPNPPSAIVQVIRLDRDTIVSEFVVTPADLDALIMHICDLVTELRKVLLKLGVTA